MQNFGRFLDAYRFPGCTTRSRVKGMFGDPHTLVVRLDRRQKKQSAVRAALRSLHFMIVAGSESVIWRAVQNASSLMSRFAASTTRSVAL